MVVLVSVPVGLPPAGVVLADDVEDVSLLEGQAQLPTRNEGVIRWVIVKVSSYMHLRTDRVYNVKVGIACITDRRSLTHTHAPTSLETYHSLSVRGRFNLRAWDEEEGKSAMHLLLKEKMRRNELKMTGTAFP